MMPAAAIGHRKGAAVKKERLEARITAEQKELLKRAADLTGRSLTDFVVSSAQEAATRTLRDRDVLALSARDGRAFVTALLKPPAPGPRLRRAARQYRDAVGDPS